MTLSKLQNTTVVSTELTHSRIKILAAKIGVSEDIISRLALGVSIREGPISDNWPFWHMKQFNYGPVNTGNNPGINLNKV